MAVMFHVPYRTTRDIAVLIEPTIENAHRVRRALQKWGGFEPKFTAQEFIAGDILSFGGLLRVKVHSNVPGATWDQIAKPQVDGSFGGVATHFASLDDLIAMKEASGRREKDLPDLRRLRRLREKLGR